MRPPPLSDRGFEHDDSGRAARRAREVAPTHEAPVLVWKDGKVVAVEP
jgi:hypothetical protein